MRIRIKCEKLDKSFYFEEILGGRTNSNGEIELHTLLYHVVVLHLKIVLQYAVDVGCHLKN